MTNQNQDSYIKKYMHKIENMDKEAAKWTSSIRSEYESVRDAFREKLDKSQNIAEDKWADFRTNIDESWTSVEEAWRQFSEAGSDEEMKTA